MRQRTKGWQRALSAPSWAQHAQYGMACVHQPLAAAIAFQSGRYALTLQQADMRLLGAFAAGQVSLCRARLCKAGPPVLVWPSCFKCLAAQPKRMAGSADCEQDLGCIQENSCREAQTSLPGLTGVVCCVQLPLYIPSPQERQDPKLYASNVRKYMVRALSTGTVRPCRIRGSGMPAGQCLWEQAVQVLQAACVQHPCLCRPGRRVVRAEGHGVG